MARLGDKAGTDMLDLLGFECLCSWCQLSATCADYNLHHRDTIIRRINGYEVTCNNHKPAWHRGVEGVRP